MCIKYEPKNADSEQKNVSIALKIASVAIIVLSLLTIFLCFKKSPGTEAAQKKTTSTCKNLKKPKKSKSKKKSGTKKSKKKKKAKTLAQAKTTLQQNKSQSNRVFNIKKAVKTLNNTTLKPGEEFSFENIYSLSHKNGKFKCTRDSNTKEIIYAGGISQVSTTLLHAVKKAKLPVTELHNFKHQVFYSPKNNTAMFRKGKANFKFRNLKSYPVKIKASVVKNCIKIKILKMKKPKN